MPIIPFLCPACGAVWFGKSPIGFGPSSKVRLENVAASACLKCGKPGRMPDGFYEHTQITITNPSHATLILDALTAIQRMVEANAAPEEIAKTIDERYPFLGYLKEFLPKDLKDLAVLVTVLLALTRSCDNQIPEAPPSDLAAQEKIVEALRDIVSRLESTPPVPPPR